MESGPSSRRRITRQPAAVWLASGAIVTGPRRHRKNAAVDAISACDSVSKARYSFTQGVAAKKRYRALLTLSHAEMASTAAFLRCRRGPVTIAPEASQTAAGCRVMRRREEGPDSIEQGDG